MIRIADNYGSIREAMLALRPTTPAIVHAGNLMPISSLNLDDERFSVEIDYRTFMPEFHESGVIYDQGTRFSRGGQIVSRGYAVGQPEMPSMTILQIDRWNSLRYRTGMFLRPILDRPPRRLQLQ